MAAEPPIRMAAEPPTRMAAEPPTRMAAEVTHRPDAAAPFIGLWRAFFAVRDSMNANCEGSERDRLGR